MCLNKCTLLISCFSIVAHEVLNHVLFMVYTESNQLVKCLLKYGPVYIVQARCLYGCRIELMASQTLIGAEQSQLRALLVWQEALAALFPPHLLLHLHTHTHSHFEGFQPMDSGHIGLHLCGAHAGLFFLSASSFMNPVPGDMQYLMCVELLPIGYL